MHKFRGMMLKTLSSHSLPPNHLNVDDVVDSLSRMLSMHHPLPIIEFNKIMGSIGKRDDHFTVFSLFK